MGRGMLPGLEVVSILYYVIVLYDREPLEGGLFNWLSRNWQMLCSALFDEGDIDNTI